MLHNLCTLYLMRIRTEGIFVIYLEVKLICLEIPVHISLQSSNNANQNSFLLLFYDLLTQLAVISRKQTCHSRTPKEASFCPTFIFFATIIHTLALGPVLFTVSLKSYYFFHTHNLNHECERRNRTNCIKNFKKKLSMKS